MGVNLYRYTGTAFPQQVAAMRMSDGSVNSDPTDPPQQPCRHAGLRTEWVGRMGRRLFQKFVRAGRDGRPSTAGFHGPL